MGLLNSIGDGISIYASEVKRIAQEQLKEMVKIIPVNNYTGDPEIDSGLGGGNEENDK